MRATECPPCWPAPSIMVDTQASSDYLSTARLLRRSRQTCYIYNHTCSTTTRGERDLLPSKGWLPSSTSPPPATAAKPQQSLCRCSRPLSVQLQATSDDQKVHSVETDLELMQCPSGLKVRPSERAWNTSTLPASQLLTQNPPMVIPLMLLFQRDGPCKGRLKKTSSGQEKKKKIK